MKREEIKQLPIYPEQILRLFSLAQRHTLMREGKTIQAFYPELTELQQQLLALLGVSRQAFRPPA